MSFLLPVPFILLFQSKTDKLDFLATNPYSVFLILVFLQIIFSNNLGYNFGLIIAYITFVLFGAFIFTRNGWIYPRALSLSFCLTYFGSFLWELPTHIYTIIVHGGIDGAFPLHLLFVFPMIFIFEKVQTNKTLKEITSTVSFLLIISTLTLTILVAGGYHIWNVFENSPLDRIVEELLWMLNRVIVVTGLFSIYKKSSLRGEKFE